MSQENVELVRQATEAFSRGDFEGFLQSWAPDAVVDWSNSRGLEARVYRGHADIRAFATQFREAFEDFRVELVDLVEVEDGVLVAENMPTCMVEPRGPSPGPKRLADHDTRRPADLPHALPDEAGSP